MDDQTVSSVIADHAARLGDPRDQVCGGPMSEDAVHVRWAVR